jgi:hypothetical protein
MERTADERREILRAFIKEQRAEDRALGQGVRRRQELDLQFPQRPFERAGPADLRQARAHCRRPDLAHQRGGPGTAVANVDLGFGSVEAGTFREAVEWDRSRWYSVDVPVPERFRRRAKALRSPRFQMDLEYRPGAVVIWVDVLDFRPPRTKDHVIVYATIATARSKRR